MYLIKIRNDEDHDKQLVSLVEAKEWEGDAIREAITFLADVEEDNITKKLLDSYSINREFIEWNHVEIAEFLRDNLDPCTLVDLYNLVKKINRS